MIPEKAQGKVLQATVVAVGSGARGKVSIQLKHQLGQLEGGSRKGMAAEYVESYSTKTERGD